MFKKLVFLEICILFFLLAACVDSGPKYDNIAALRCSDGIQNFDETGVDCGGNSCNTVCPPYPNEIKGEVVWRTVLTPNKVYTLSGPLLVREGMILEINAGTVIKAVPGTNAHIAVLPGAKLWVWGTQEAPVIMTSAAENPKPGDWGGVMMLGNAVVPQQERPRSKVGNYFYGGDSEFDSSGQLRYLKIEYAGALYKEGLNYESLGLYGLGPYTKIDFVHVTNSLGTAIGIYGGHVNASHILATKSTTNGIEISESWSGKGDNWYLSGISNYGISLGETIIGIEKQLGFSLSSIVLKGPLLGAAFKFNQATVKGNISELTFSAIDTAFYSEDQAILKALENNPFSITNIGFENKPSDFLWYSGQTNTPPFVSLSIENTSANLPSWALPIQ